MFCKNAQDTQKKNKPKKKRGISMTTAILIAIALAIAVYIHTSPQFGSTEALMNIDRIENAENKRRGRFYNQEPMRYKSSIGTIWKFFTASGRSPKNRLPIVKLADDYFDHAPEKARITWFGHSAMMIEIDQKRILLDPMLMKRMQPAPWLMGKRYSEILPMSIDKLPTVDAVIISHDHYDHLDYGSIMALKERVGHFYVPLGVGSHLISWGIPKDKITELNWWEDATLDTLTFTLTPSRHFSGRGITDGNKKLWGSWVIRGESEKLFFSGDSGYSRDFKKIGEKYGPFDLTMVEAGQYHENWPNVHMTPAEAIQAHIDLKGKMMMPIHWCAFTLSLHGWKDPAIGTHKIAKERGVTLASPMIGEAVIIGDTPPQKTWWESLE